MRKTAPHLRTRQLLLVLLYLAAALAPMAHRVVEEFASACEVCHHAAPLGTLVAADCQGPCHDPAHHHHPHHDEQRCPTCQSGATTTPVPGNPVVLIAAAAAGRMTAPAALPPAPNHDVRISPARAPPTARIA